MAILKKNAKVKKSSCVFSLLYEDIRKGISAGNYPPGMELPSEQELASKYRISRSSVRTGLDALLKENLIEKRPGIGSFIRDISLDAPETTVTSIGINAPMRELEPWFSARIVDTMMKVCGEKHVRCTLFERDGFSEKQVDGAMLLMASPEDNLSMELAGSGIPTLLFNRVSVHKDIAYVSVNYREESCKALKFMLDQGKKRILIPNVSSGEKLRTLGIMDALADCPERGVIYETEAKKDSAYYTERLRGAILAVDPDAIYLPNGSYAVPALNAMRDLNRNDIPMICFDDIRYLQSMYFPKFYSVVMPLEKMTRDAAEYLIEKVRHPDAVPVLKKFYNAKII